MPEKYHLLTDVNAKQMPMVIRRALSVSALRLAAAHDPDTPAPDILPILSVHFMFKGDSLQFTFRDANGNPL